MLTRLSSTSARITEVGDAAERLAVLFKKHEKLHEDKFLVATMDEIATLGDKITEATRRDNVLSKLEELEELDIVRDNALRVLGKLASAYEVIPVDDIRVHGEKLAAIFNKYGMKMTQASYSEESNLISSLLKDLSVKSLEAGIAKMPGVQQAIDTVRDAQAKFAEVRADYEHTQNVQAASANATSLRKPLVALINGKLLTYLDAMCVASAEQYRPFADDCSKIITSINAAVKNRSKKEAKPKEMKNEGIEGMYNYRF